MNLELTTKDKEFIEYINFCAKEIIKLYRIRPILIQDTEQLRFET